VGCDVLEGESMRLEINGEYLPSHYQMRLLYDIVEQLPDCGVWAEVFNSTAKIRVTDRYTHEFTVGYVANVEDDEEWDTMFDHVMKFFAATYTLSEEEAND
jgi:hypothetical protein